MHKCNPSSTSLNDANGCQRKSCPFRSKIEIKEFILWRNFMRNEPLRKNFPSVQTLSNYKKTNSHGSYVPSPISLSQWNGRRLT